MKRFLEKDLIEWKDSPLRKPIILRGARQVGKSYLISNNLSKKFGDYLEVNLEREPDLKACFEGELSANTVIRNLEALKKHRIIAGQTLLFLDEVQACPQAITALRYLYEEMPSLHVIAAGSLLDFALEQVGNPVGRVTFRQLMPLTFEEYLENSGNQILIENYGNHDISKSLPQALHDRSLKLLNQYFAVGGFPEAVNTLINSMDYLKCEQILTDILFAYRNDFPKYTKRNSELGKIDLVFDRVARIIGQQFKYVQITQDFQAKYVKKAMAALNKAGILHFVYRSYGIPLNAKADLDRFKILFIDVGLMQQACGLRISQWINNPNQLINSGAVAEQFVGQQLLAYVDQLNNPLHYWARDKRGSSAEVDYVIESAGQIIPIEVKSGAAGKLRSMMQFFEAHPNCPYGLKVSLENYSRVGKIQSIPLYAFGTWLRSKI